MHSISISCRSAKWRWTPSQPSPRSFPQPGPTSDASPRPQPERRTRTLWKLSSRRSQQQVFCNCFSANLILLDVDLVLSSHVAVPLSDFSQMMCGTTSGGLARVLTSLQGGCLFASPAVHSLCWSRRPPPRPGWRSYYSKRLRLGRSCTLRHGCRKQTGSRWACLSQQPQRGGPVRLGASRFRCRPETALHTAL